jgi:hypothetical protein
MRQGFWRTPEDAERDFHICMWWSYD